MAITHTLTCSACYCTSTETLCMASPAMTRKRRKYLTLELFLQFFILFPYHIPALPNSFIKSYQVAFFFFCCTFWAFTTKRRVRI